MTTMCAGGPVQVHGGGSSKMRFMGEHMVSAIEAAGLLGISDKTLRARLRRERPAAAVQRPDQRHGNWFLTRPYVEELAAERGVSLPPWHAAGEPS